MAHDEKTSGVEPGNDVGNLKPGVALLRAVSGGDVAPTLFVAAPWHRLSISMCR